MQIPCSNCGHLLPAGASFCANCGAAQKPASQPQPSSPASAETVRVGGPPPGADYAPTQFQPPPAPAAPTQQVPAGLDPYALQYTPSQPPPPPSYGQASGPNGVYSSVPPQGAVMPPPPLYAPGPPPAAPGGVVQPWAQPQKKRSGAKVALGCLIALVLVVAVLGGGGYLLIKALSSKGGNTSHQGNSSTPGAGSTPGSDSGNAQTLDNLNRQAIYAGINVTIVSAKQAASLPGREESDPSLNALSIQMKAVNQTAAGVYPTIAVTSSDGNTYSAATSVPASFGVSWGANSSASGSVLFDVPASSKIGDFTVQIGSAKELLVKVPLAGDYDPNQWQPVTHQIGQTVTYDNGQIKGTVTQVVVTTWNPGYQAPKDQRFLQMYLHVTNNTAFSINVGDGTPPQYLLVFPNGDRTQPNNLYGSMIDEVVGGGESRDVGYDTFLIPITPAPYVIVFLNPDGSTAGQVDLGTL